jgi:hypothetical protein
MCLRLAQAFESFDPSCPCIAVSAVQSVANRRAARIVILLVLVAVAAIEARRRLPWRCAGSCLCGAISSGTPGYERQMC